MKPKGQKIVYYIGLIIGLLGFLLGMTVAIAAAPLVGSIVTAGFILVFGLAFGLPYLRNRKRLSLLKTGLRANGKIIEMWDTAVTINNQPQIGLKIEVTPQAGPPFVSEIQMVISRLQTAYYQVGVTCIVKYDPNDKKTVAIESIGESLGNDSYQSPNSNAYINSYLNNASASSAPQDNPYFPGKTSDQIEQILIAKDTENKRIFSIGIECKAIIKTCDFMNVYDSGTNEFNIFTVEVLPDNQPAYEASCIALVSAASKAKYQPGKVVWVKYDPANKNKITLSHS
jgi:hypothetical protein